MRSWRWFNTLVLALIFGLGSGCASLSANQKIYLADARPALQTNADKLRAISPSVRWQTIAEGMEINELKAMPSGQVLVGFVNLEKRHSPSWEISPQSGPYALYDLATGRMLWKHERNVDPAILYRVIVTDPLIVYLHSTSSKLIFRALRPTDGTVAWEKRYRGSSLFLDYDLSSRLVLIHSVGEKSSVEALDVDSGVIRWEYDLKQSAMPPLTEFDGDSVLIVSSDISCLSASSGSPRWVLTERGKFGSPMAILVQEDAYLVVYGQGEIRQISKSGRLLWNRKVDAKVDRAALSQGSVTLALSNVQRQSNSLLAMSLSDGKTLWGKEIGGRLKSAISVSEDRLFYTTAESIEALTTGTGKVAFRTSLKGSDPRRMPDHLSLYPDHVVVASEGSVSSFDRGSGRETWHYSLRGVDYLLSTISGGYSSRSVEGRTDQAQAALQGFKAISSILDARDSSIAQGWQRYNNVVSKTSFAVSSGNREQRSDAYRARSDAAMSARLNAQTARSFATMQIAVQGVFNVLDAARAYAAEKVAGDRAAREERRAWKAGFSATANFNSVQNDLFIRPVQWELGSGLVIVNLSDGKWAEVVCSPSEGHLVDDLALNLNLGLTFPKSGILVTKGAGLDPQKWIASSANLATTVKRSILSFYLADLSFQDPSLYDTKSMTLKKGRILQQSSR